jgi:hypothetical protein
MIGIFMIKYLPVVFGGSTTGAVVDRSLISGSIEIANEGAIEAICCFVQSMALLSSKVA